MISEFEKNEKSTILNSATEFEIVTEKIGH